MFRWLVRLFCGIPLPRAAFVDWQWGEFAFERGLGWKKRIALGGGEVELVLGSDGEPPSEEMLRTARAWVDAWPRERPQIVDYIRRELAAWIHDQDLPDPERLEVESLNILWPRAPKTAMIYFTYRGDDLRAWHITCEGFKPRGFAYDD